jgi:hypothetical protein
MKTKPLLHLIGALICHASIADAETIPFPGGTFENDPATHWASSTTGVAATAFPNDGSNTLGRISPTAGSGSLRATVPNSDFQANSLYEISFEFSGGNLLAVGSGYAIEIRDGSNNVVATLTNDQLVGLLGVNLGPVDTLSLDLNSLTGALTDSDLLLGNLRDLLGSLADNGALLAEIQALLNQLVAGGADSDLLQAVVDLLEDVLTGAVDPGTLDDQLIADLLGLNVLDPVVAAVSDLIGSLAGNEDPVTALTGLLTAILGNPGDLGLVNDLLTTLLGESDLLGEVSNILNLSLVEDVLGTLTSGDTLGLLGLLNPGQGGTQTAKLLFTTGSTPPTGNLDVVLQGSATLGLLSFDYDNIGVRRFDLVSTPTPPNPGANAGTRPIVNPKRQRVIRRITSPQVTISGTAQALGQNNAIRKVEVSVRGSGVPASSKRFKAVKGKEQWSARVRVPVSPRTRLLFRAEDLRGQKSINELVRVSRK